MKKEKIIIVCLDSFRFDYLEKTRFLKNLAKRHKYGMLETVLGFNSIGASLLTGKEPQEHGIFTKFWYTPGNSPFKFLGKFSFLEGGWGEGWLRKLAELWFMLRQFLKGGYLTRIYKLPLARIGDFDVSSRKAFTELGAFGRIKSIPDILREKGIKFLFFDWPVIAGSGGRRIDFCLNQDEAKLRSLLRHKEEAEFFWIKFWDLDTVAHKFGVESKQAREVLRGLDDISERLVESFGGEEKVDFLFWADHGMVEVKKTIDIESLFKDFKVKMFLDSTLARFWETKGKEKEILRRLRGLPGKILGEGERKKYKIDFGHKKYGEIIFLAEPGVLIYPNYFEGKVKYKAMHGYDPAYPDQKGIYISSLGRGRENKKMTEMFGEIKGLIDNRY